MFCWIQALCRVVVVLVLWLAGSWPAAEAGVNGFRLHLSRSPDVPLGRLDRPVRDRDRSPKSQPQTVLSQSAAIALAKEAMKEELGKAYRDYEVKSVVFDAGKKEWSISFEPAAAPKSAVGCVTVFVDDETRETMLLRCR